MNKNLLAMKIKIKSLAAEARIIREEELKLRALNRKLGNINYNKNFNKINEAREYLYEHRIFVVRNEIRAASLAYAFLRGKNYRDVENNSRKGFRCIFIRTRDIIAKFRGSKLSSEQLKELMNWFEKPSQLEIPLSCEKVSVELETA